MESSSLATSPISCFCLPYIEMIIIIIIIVHDDEEIILLAYLLTYTC